MAQHRFGRSKMINRSALTSRKLAALPANAERLYWRIYLASDNYGTMPGEPWDVWHTVAPGVKGMTEQVVSTSINQMVEAGLLLRWSFGGREWLHLVGHDSYQTKDWLRKRGTRYTPELPANHGNDALGATTDAPITNNLQPPTEGLSITNVISPAVPAGMPVKNSTKADIREVFEHWRTVFNKNAKTSLDSKRETAIRKAITLRDKADAIRCLDGYASDPWRHEAAVRHEIATLFRDAAHIEAGLDKLKNATAAASNEQHDQIKHGVANGLLGTPKPVDPYWTPEAYEARILAAFEEEAS